MVFLSSLPQNDGIVTLGDDVGYECRERSAATVLRLSLRGRSTYDSNNLGRLAIRSATLRTQFRGVAAATLPTLLRHSISFAVGDDCAMTVTAGLHRRPEAQR
jgi:hypothetical protein